MKLPVDLKKVGEAVKKVTNAGDTVKKVTKAGDAVKKVKNAGDALKSIKDIGTTLKALREGKGWSLEDVVAKSKIALTTLKGIEGNKIKPSIDMITTLAKQYGVDVKSLLGGKK